MSKDIRITVEHFDKAASTSSIHRYEGQLTEAQEFKFKMKMKKLLSKFSIKEYIQEAR